MSTTTIRYIAGDATEPRGHGHKICAHVCNDEGRWGRGFVVAVSARWPQPEAQYRLWHRHRASNDFGLGAVQLVEVCPDLHIANMIGQHGIRRSRSSHPIRYDALERCLATLADHAHTLNASVHVPRIGTGLAGGTWNKIEPLIIAQLCDNAIPVTVYDLTPNPADPHPRTSAPR
ncbi:hypothetical protein [Nocardia nova]|uniref:hypothetical protein n=1 Tax=Nocardia nova TaxID=37330 RepID=UPI0033C12AA6